MAKHIHADLMLQYAQDAQETDKPWERWEYNRCDGFGWVDMKSHPLWTTKASYCRKQKTLSVTLANGEVVSWPAPHRTELEYGDAYFYIDVDGAAVVEEWDCVAWDISTLSNGWLHLTKEAAEQHADALRKINNQVAK